MSHVAIDEATCDVLLQGADVDLVKLTTSDTQAPIVGIVSRHVGGVRFVVRPGTQNPATLRYLVIPSEFHESLQSVENPNATLRRVMRAALTQMTKGRFLPPSWAPYHDGRLTIFYGSTVEQGGRGISSRVIIEERPQGTEHVLLVEHEESNAEIDLRRFEVRPEQYAALAAVKDALPRLREMSLEITVEDPALRNSVELHLPTSIIDEEGTYTDWLARLTPRQMEFVRRPIKGPTTLRGAAGTGKSLALAMKALREVYSARGLVDADISEEEQSETRVLIVTHNWASAEAIRSSVSALDEHSIAEANPTPIVVRTLQSLAIDMLQLRNTEIVPLSEDGHDGKAMQRELLDSLIAKFVEAEWSLYRRRCSDSFRKGITSAFDSMERSNFCDEMIGEFACVISPERDLTKEAYLATPRTKWMMELTERADREVVFLLYQRFRMQMHEELGTLSLFDMVNDLLRYVDSNTWDMLRKKRGYDYVFVDEFHLFNKNEHLAFRYLLKSGGEGAQLVAALDPRQSPNGVFSASYSASAGRSVAGALGGEVSEHELDQVFRYTKQIDDVVRALEDQWSFDLGSDWDIPPRVATQQGDLPEVVEFAGRLSAFAGAIRIAKEQVAAGRTTAVLFLTKDGFNEGIRSLSSNDARMKVLVVGDRDDTRVTEEGVRKVVLSQPEYVAGLQFDAVVIADATHARFERIGERAKTRRAWWSWIYLAMTRARRNLFLMSSEEEQGLVHLLGPADNRGLLRRVKG